VNIKLAGLSAALALLVAAPVCADQSSGRSSVYASPSAGSTPPKIEKAEPGNGRNSVYARDLPAPTPRDRAQALLIRPGRA
jgi:hypothetical protein